MHIKRHEVKIMHEFDSDICNFMNWIKENRDNWDALTGKTAAEITDLPAILRSLSDNGLHSVFFHVFCKNITSIIYIENYNGLITDLQKSIIRELEKFTDIHG